MAPHLHTMGSRMFLAEHSKQLSNIKVHGHLCKVQALPSLRQLDQLDQVPPIGNFMKHNNPWASILTCQGVLIIVEPLPVCVPMEILTISDWWHRVYIEILGPAIYHACPTVSITFKDFTRCQIVLRNPSVKLRIQCLFIHSPINCICNTDFLWSIFSCDNILQFVTDVVQIMGVFDKLIQCTMLISSSITSPCIIPLHVFWTIVLLSIILLLFRIDVLKFSRYKVIGNELTHTFSRKCGPSQTIIATMKASKCSDKTVFQTTTWCLQTKAPLRSCAIVLKLRYCISGAYRVKYTSFYSNFSLQDNLFYSFRYSLISIHSVEKNSAITAVVIIPNTLWLNAPMFYHLWCRTNAALMRTSTNHLFSSKCTTWLIDVHPTWSE